MSTTEPQFIRKVFMDVYDGKTNFMTPTPLEYIELHELALAEISEGRGLRPNTKIYGVTVLVYYQGQWSPGFPRGNQLSRAPPEQLQW